MHLNSLKVVHIKGDQQKIKEFLQGQVSSDVFEQKNNSCQLSCICNQKGLVIAEFIIKKIDSEFLIVIDESLIDVFIDDLTPYAKFFGVTFDKGGELVKGSIQVNNSKIDNDAFYLQSDDYGLQIEITDDVSSILNQISIDEWNVANKLLLNFQMCAKDVALYRPLELNYDKLRVSFTKGCFRGQEIIARMHYLGVNRRTFCTVINDTDHQLELDIKILGSAISYNNLSIFSCYIDKPSQEKIQSLSNHHLISVTTN